MAIFVSRLLIAFWVFMTVCRNICPLSVSSNVQNPRHVLVISYNGMKNSTGYWEDGLKTQVIVDESAEHVNLLAIKTVEEYHNKRVITIETISNRIQRNYRPRLLFYPRSLSNVFITNGGRTVRKISEGRWETHAYTNRPLENNEIFEVMLERKETTGYPIGMGVISNLPGEITGDHEKKITTWKYYSNRIHIDDEFVKYYGDNTDSIQVGMTLGVLRTESGDLHFFINGKGQGVAATKVPPKVYGFFSLYGDGERASITDS